MLAFLVLSYVLCCYKDLICATFITTYSLIPILEPIHPFSVFCESIICGYHLLEDYPYYCYDSSRAPNILVSWVYVFQKTSGFFNQNNIWPSHYHHLY
jgi:hypothetical protein